VAAVAALRPEIVLLDIQLPDLDGIIVAEQLAAAPDAPAVVLISSRDAAAYGPRLQAAPARGFIPKSGLSGEALAAMTG
jgi:DNA-binding NarL/FixJ family response regulator